jgi:urea-proton symporter
MLTVPSDAGISVTIGSATVFLDQSYWQRAIASHPQGTTKAYLLGGLSWFSVPFAFGTIMGLSARALQNNPAFPTYPQPLSIAQQDAGLVAPAAAVALKGTSGAIAMLVVTYMAVTSACSAQLISISSIFTYDVYRVSGTINQYYGKSEGIEHLKKDILEAQSKRS